MKESLEFKAFKSEREEQEARGAELASKVKGVEDARREMQATDRPAKEVLDKFKNEKVRMKSLKADFDKILEDESVRKYLAKKGITTLQEYLESDEGEKDELVGKYAESQAALDKLRADLGLAVEKRAEAKDKLEAELQKNDAEAPRGTFKRLEEGANEQIQTVGQEKIDTLVDDLLDSKGQIMNDVLVQLYEKKNSSIPNIFSKKDIIKLGEYGPDYYYAAKGTLSIKAKMLADNVVYKWWNRIGSTLIDPTIINDDTLKGFKDNMWRRIDRELERADEEVSGMDQMIRKEENTKKLETMIPEVEGAFSQIDSLVRNSPYGHLVKGFRKNGEYILVAFEVSDKKNPLAKYLNNDYSEEGEINFGVMDTGSIPKKMEMIKIDLAEAEKRKGADKSQGAEFNSKNIFSKTYSRLFNSGEEKGINRRLRESEDKVKMLNNVKDLLSGLTEFMGKLEELEKNNRLYLDLQQGNISLSELKEAYIKALKKRLEP